MSFTIAIVVLKAQCKVRTEPKSGSPESKPEPYNANLEAPVFSVHRTALKLLQLEDMGTKYSVRL